VAGRRRVRTFRRRTGPDLLAQLEQGETDRDRTDVYDRRAVRPPATVAVALLPALAAFVDLRSLQVLVERSECHAVAAVLERQEKHVGHVERVIQRGLRDEHVDEPLLQRSQVAAVGLLRALEVLSCANEELVPRRAIAPRSASRGRAFGRRLRQRSRNPAGLTFARPLELVAGTCLRERRLGARLADLELPPVPP